MFSIQSMFSSFKVANRSNVNFNKSLLFKQQKMYRRRTVGKPHPKAALDPDGEPIINEAKLEKVYRWRPEQIEAFRNYVRRMAIQVRNIPEGERMPALQRLIDEYINGVWGRYVAEIRKKAIERRKHRLKKRAYTKTARKMLRWQQVQDMKEQKIIRDLEREDREARGEQFSFKKFLQVYKESKKAPYIVHDEETFEKFLEQEMSRKYIRGPKSSRKPYVGTENYMTRYTAEIFDPLAYELKRKAHITRLIKEREKHIKEQKLAEEMRIKREMRQKEKEKLSMEKQLYWGSVFGQWHTENNRLKALKKEYILAREKKFADARREYLEALNLETLKFKESPDDCKYMRFALGYGVQFPYNNTYYS